MLHDLNRPGSFTGNSRHDMNDLLFTPEEHERAIDLVREFSARYHDELPGFAVFPAIDRGVIDAILDEPLPETGCSIDALFAELEEKVVPNSTQTAHPRFLPYVQPSPNAISAYADMVAGLINQNCNLWTLSPAANAIEQKVVRWFAELFDFDSTAGGLITSGGSMANLIALTAARDEHLGSTARRHGLQSRSATLVAYTSTETHSSVAKAFSTLGLGTENLRRIPHDSDFRIRLDALAEAVAQDRQDGRAPFCVIANAGTVATGAIDPIAELSGYCSDENLWLHVDGAYGALGVLSERFRGELTTLGLADSLSLDPHKLLFTSFEAGCLLVRDSASLRRSFSSAPSYLNMEQDSDLINYADYGPQLSRGFKALKVWWSLRHFGRRSYAAVIERMLDLAQHMSSIAKERPAFELLAPTTFNCVCFRASALDDSGNRALLRELVGSGIAFLGPIVIEGRFGFRACFMNLRTTDDDVVRIMNEIERLARLHCSPD